MLAFFFMLAAVYLADLATKWWIRSHMLLGGEIKVFPFFSVCYVHNTGIAFGLFQGWNAAFIALDAVVIAIITAMGLRMRRDDPFTALVLAAVMGGAMGNLTDRILHGQVTDFLDFYWR